MIGLSEYLQSTSNRSSSVNFGFFALLNPGDPLPDDPDGVMVTPAYPPMSVENCWPVDDRLAEEPALLLLLLPLDPDLFPPPPPPPPDDDLPPVAADFGVYGGTYAFLPGNCAGGGGCASCGSGAVGFCCVGTSPET